MLIVVNGKVVDGYRVFGPGAELEGFSPEAEERLIAAGLAKRVPAIDVSGDWFDGGDAVVTVAPAKEPTKAELQARCRELGLPERGTKAELQARIDAAEAGEAEIGAEEADDEPPELTAEVPR